MANTVRQWLNREYFAIENNPSYSPEEKVQHLIYATAGICGVVAMQPLPFADIFALTPIQCYMGYKIGRVRGIDLSEGDATEALKSVAGAVGMGFLAQQGVIGLYKLGVPFLGGLMTFPLVAGMTVGIGKAMDLYFRLKAEGKSASTADLKAAYEQGKKEGKNVNKPRLPNESELKEDSVPPSAPPRVPSNTDGQQAATVDMTASLRSDARDGMARLILNTSKTRSCSESFATMTVDQILSRTRRSAPPSSIPPKRIDDLRKHYSVYFSNLEFSGTALARILEGDKSDQLSFERQFKLIDSGIIEPKHSISDTRVLEAQAGKDLRIYYEANAPQRKWNVLLVGRKSTQKADLKKVRQVARS